MTQATGSARSENVRSFALSFWHLVDIEPASKAEAWRNEGAREGVGEADELNRLPVSPIINGS